MSTAEIENNDAIAATPVSLGAKPAPVATTIGLTDTAVNKVRELLAQETQPDMGLRVAVRPGGCSGFSYEMFFDAAVADDDIVTMFNDVKVIVDAASNEHVKGAKLEYKDGLQDTGFHIENPNVFSNLRLRFQLQLVRLLDDRWSRQERREFFLRYPRTTGVRPKNVGGKASRVDLECDETVG